MAGRASKKGVHRDTTVTALIACLIVGCAAESARAPVVPTASARAGACRVASLPRVAPSPELSFAELPELRVDSVEVRGARRVPVRLARRAIETRAGDPISTERVAADVRRLWELEVFEDVRVTWRPGSSGARLSYVVSERPTLRAVIADEAVRRELGLVPGLPYEPARLHARALDLELTLRNDGYSEAKVVLGGVRTGDGVDLCARVERGPRTLIERMEFVGNARVSAASLRRAMHTDDGAINVPGGVLRRDVLERDLLFLSALYYDRGMVQARVTPRVTRAPSGFRVAIEVEEGPVFRVGEVRFRAPPGVSRRRWRELLGVQRGEVFSRQRVADGLARLREQLEKPVEVQTSIDERRRVVDLVLEVAP